MKMCLYNYEKYIIEGQLEGTIGIDYESIIIKVIGKKAQGLIRYYGI